MNNNDINYMTENANKAENIKGEEKTKKENIKSEKRKDEIIKENIIIGYIQVDKYEDIGGKWKLRNHLTERLINSQKDNEEEIKDCEIFINDNKIDFTYIYEFPKDGIYEIKYVFKKFLKSTNFMFYNCNSLISLNLFNLILIMLEITIVCFIIANH